MKILIKNRVDIFLILLFLVSPDLSKAQYFTKINNVITNDAGNSRSVNWIDYDNDGDLDAYVSNGVNPPMNSFLYENTGNGNFVKHTDSQVCKNNTSADGSSWADYNNDGNLDLFIVAWWGQRDLLYTNSGNENFQEYTEGILGRLSGYSESCSWGDYDNDGFVDLYVANSGQNGTVANYFFHNNCGESFTRILEWAPAKDKATSRTVNWVDYDNDGDMDLYISNETNEKNNLYKNMLKETGVPGFESVTNDPVVTSSYNSISSCWGDYNNDGYLDLYVANWGQNNELFKNNGNGTFTYISDGPQSNDGSCSFGCNWGDFDNDGDLDLFVANGWCNGNQNNLLYRNQLIETGVATFEKIDDTVLTKDGGWSYGSSWGDYDNDGDLDLLVAKCSQDGQGNNNSLFRNEIGNAKNWLTVKCVGYISNKSAIGTKILVKSTINSTPVWQMREISAQESYCSENLFAHFGLGNATVIDSIIVKWPSGIIQYLKNVEKNQFLTISEDTLLFSGTKPSCKIYTDIENPTENGSGNFKLYPNPVYNKAVIEYSVTKPGKVIISLFDTSGKMITTTYKYCLPGKYSEPIETTNLSKGLYIIRITSPDISEIKKVIVAKNSD